MKSLTGPAQRIVLIGLLCIALCGAARADVIADWNAVAVQSTATAARPGATGVLDLATVHAGMYDAVQAIEKRYEPYYVEVPGASGSPVAAAAKAAHDILVNRFPAQTANLDVFYQQYLIDHGILPTDPGIAVGATAAQGIIALRACDGSFPTVAPPPFTGGTQVGMWRPTPPANLPMLAPWLGSVVPFLLTRQSQFRSDGPPPLESRRYAIDYNEVKTLGALNGSSRTPEQTDIAQFWAGSPVVAWNRALRDIATEHIDNVADSSRLFALTDMAVADALISAWADKKFYVSWRPITAIREGDTDGNPRTAPDPTWESLIVTPPYPDNPSGAANYASAVATMLENIFETDSLTFSVTTTNTGPTTQDTRTFDRFSDAADEVVEARIYSGIHFRFADAAARKQGREIARWGFRNFMRPLRGSDLSAGRESWRTDAGVARAFGH